VKDAVAPRTFRLRDPVEKAQEQVQEFADTLLRELSTEQFEKLRYISRGCCKVENMT